MGLEYPQLTVLICTYNRPRELAETLKALYSLIDYPRQCLHWLIADDSSPYNVTDLINRVMPEHFSFRVLKTPFNSGWGANVNYAMRQVQTPYIYFTEDDYLLTRPLELRLGVALMESIPAYRVGMLRYFGTGGDTKLLLEQCEADVSAWLPDHRDGFGLPGKQTYLRLMPESDSLWLYSNRPHLKKAHFHGFYGDYRFGLRLGATEESFAHTVKDGLRAFPDTAPQIAILPDWVAPRFHHIGTSFQGSEFDK